MKYQDIYALAVETGMRADPRGYAGAAKVIERAQKEYDKLDAEEKEFFDPEKLVNPYADTRMLTGDGAAEIKRILAGVDVEMGELLLAERLAARGRSIDLLLAHHPEGRAHVGLPEVMHLQPGAMANYGVLKNVAESLMDPRAKEVEISVGVSNYNRSVDAAALLGYNMMCCHTPCDNLVNGFVTELMEREQPDTVGDVVKLLRTLSEYHASARQGNPPSIINGNASRSAGKVYVDMTGGTGGPKEYARLLSEAGVSTMLCMHMRKEALDVAKEAHINVVIAGHMASDSIGMNLFLDKLEAQGVDIIPCSGLIRVSRN